MKVRELIEHLQRMPGGNEVVLSSDGEGNSYSPCGWVKCLMWSRDEVAVGPDKLTPELEREGYTEEDITEGVPAAVLWPDN